MKYVFFWEDRFNNNNYANASLDPNLSPFNELLNLNGKENMMSLDIFEKIDEKNPNEDILLCFLTSLHHSWCPHFHLGAPVAVICSLCFQ